MEAYTDHLTDAMAYSLAQQGIINAECERKSPNFPQTVKINNTDYPLPDRRYIKLHKFKNVLSVDPQQSIISQAMERQAKEMRWQAEKLRQAGIPVFNLSPYSEIDSTSFSAELTMHFQIPKQFEYKYFYALYEITEATQKAAEYAKNKIMQFLYDYDTGR